MPAALALVGAAASVSAGVAAGGIIGGVMIAGGVMTGLGAITGNKKLQKWGGILGLAGGIAGLASGAWSSAASSVAEEAARESFRASELGAQAAAGGDLVGSAAGGLGEAAGSLMQANMGAGLGTTDIGVGSASAGGAQPWQTPGINGNAPSIPTTVNIVNGGGTQGTAGGFQGVADGLKQRVSDLLPGTGSSRGGRMLSSIGGTIKDGFDWAGKSDANARIVQAGAGILTAGLGAYGQQEALKTQMRLQEEQQARARKRLSDSVQGVQVPVYQRRGG